MKKLLFAGMAAALALSGVATAQTMGSTTTKPGTTTGQTGTMDQGSMGQTGTTDRGTMGQTGTMDRGTMGQTGTMDNNSMALMGKVTNVDKKKNMMTLEVPISPTAQVMRDGKTVSLDQVKKGDDVRASFDPATSAITQIQVAPKDHMMKDQTNR